MTNDNQVGQQVMVIFENDRMYKYFQYEHLPPHLQKTSKLFFDLAANLCDNVLQGPERTVALRKLLESKDAAVRATLYAGG